MQEKTTNKMSINISVIIMICVMGIMTATTGTMAPNVAEALGVHPETMGIGTTFYAIGMLIGSAAGGIMAERMGKRIVLMAGSFIMGCGLITNVLTASLVGSFPLYLFGSFLGGFGFTPCEANGNALLGDNNPGRESAIINICQMFYAAVAIVAPMAAVAAVSAGAKWQYVYLSVAAMYIIIGIVVFSLKSVDQVKTATEGGEKDTMGIMEVFKSKTFCLLCLVMFLMTCYESVAVIYGNLHLINSSVPEKTAAIGVSLYQAGTTLGRFICIFLSGKESKGMKVLTVFAPIGLALVLFAPVTALRLVGLGMLGLGTGPVWPLLFVLALKQYPAHTGIAGSALDMFMCAGYIIWPTVIGALMQNTTTTLTVCLGAAAIVFVLTLVFRDKEPTQ